MAHSLKGPWKAHCQMDAQVLLPDPYSNVMQNSLFKTVSVAVFECLNSHFMYWYMFMHLLLNNILKTVLVCGLERYQK